MLAARATGTQLGFALSFGLLALATAFPFGCTTMVVEVAVAVLMLFGFLEPSATWQWLMGPGSWFATAYQLIGAVWFVALVLVYAVPIGLFVR